MGNIAATPARYMMAEQSKSNDIIGCRSMNVRLDGPGDLVTADERDDLIAVANGLLRIEIEKRSGRIVQLMYYGVDLLGSTGGKGAGSKGGYWSIAPTQPRLGSCDAACLLVDPAKNGGAYAVVSCRRSYDGRSDAVPLDYDLRYALFRGQSDLYLYSIWHHENGYPAISINMGRFALKLNPEVFDMLIVDSFRQRVMPTSEDWAKGLKTDLKEARLLTTGKHSGEIEHKYAYAAALFDTPAYGWASTAKGIGIWMINPSTEYIAGGATKVELTGHLDGKAQARPTLLNIWNGPHYGGSSLVLDADEMWTKVVGPFVLYCNSGSDGVGLWNDALVVAADEKARWPYSWAADSAYPPKERRGIVSGRIVVNDPIVRQSDLKNLRIGLTSPDYRVKSATGKHGKVDWQRDGKHYQFWVNADSSGSFSVPNVRPGNYTFHVIADGVLGEFIRTGIAVEAGESLELGDLEWIPLRFGHQLWEIGIPNRSASEFRNGNRYWGGESYRNYALEFPNDVNFTIGRSDWRVDWNCVQPPRMDGSRAIPTTWSITFSLSYAPIGTVILRLAIVGSRAPKGIEISVNGQVVGGTGRLPNSGVMHREGIRGYWCERDVLFPASLLCLGENIVGLHVPATKWTHGVLYDYLRLELRSK
jgi:rhamnogalacturonan endolyase